MVRAHTKPISTALAALAVLIQAFLPTSAALAQSAGLDVSQFLCVTIEESPSARAQQFAEDFARLLKGEEPEERTTSGHCPFCVLAAQAVLPEHTGALVPSLSTADARPNFSNPGYVSLQRGPPVGLRAPPAHT